MSSRLLMVRWAILWTSRLCFLYVNNLYRDVKMIFMIFLHLRFMYLQNCESLDCFNVIYLSLWGVLCVNLNLKFASQLNAVVVVDSASWLVGARTQLRHQSPWVFWSVGERPLSPLLNESNYNLRRNWPKHLLKNNIASRTKRAENFFTFRYFN